MWNGRSDLFQTKKDKIEKMLANLIGKEWSN